ncbi:hypothetical protein BIW11_09654 [Tropilaelaps mercedesae]|uniref:Uncharacterized protein n=1 Tax=Tropilaelaps mercedesae TaxID=418985 RepID=A0A1V9XJ47_9ACAR|nr:hypothetical protein BIW11_09654 [Tropilaelaps mercedesae]
MRLHFSVTIHNDVEFSIILEAEIVITVLTSSVEFGSVLLVLVRHAISVPTVALPPVALSRFLLLHRCVSM